MKKLIAVFTLLILSCGTAMASALPSWSNLYNSFTQGASLHFLDNVQASYYRDLVNGENRAATTTSFLDYGFLSAIAGATTGSFDVTPTKELSAILGGTVNATKLIGLAYPQAKDIIHSITPDSTHKLLESAWIGFVFSHELNYDANRKQWTYGIVSGLSF